MRGSLLRFVLIAFFILKNSSIALSCLHGEKKQAIVMGECLHKVCPKCIKNQLRRRYIKFSPYDLNHLQAAFFTCPKCFRCNFISLEQLKIIFRSSLQKLIVHSVARFSHLNNRVYIPRLLEFLNQNEDPVFLQRMYFRFLKKSHSLNNLDFGFKLNSLVYLIEQEQKRNMLIPPFVEQGSDDSANQDLIPMAIEAPDVL